MQKIIFVFLLIFFQHQNTFGAGFLEATDTIPRKYSSGHKLSQKHFLDQYGKDDSSRALIRYYFQNRNVPKIILFFGAGISAASGIAYALIWAGGGPFIGLGALFIIIIVLSGLYLGAISALTGFVFFMSYPRKKLLRFLENYNRGNGIPKKIQRKGSFKSFLKAERNYKLNK